MNSTLSSVTCHEALQYRLPGRSRHPRAPLHQTTRVPSSAFCLDNHGACESHFTRRPRCPSATPARTITESASPASLEDHVAFQNLLPKQSQRTPLLRFRTTTGLTSTIFPDDDGAISADDLGALQCCLPGLPRCFPAPLLWMTTLPSRCSFLDDHASHQRHVPGRPRCIPALPYWMILLSLTSNLPDNHCSFTYDHAAQHCRPPR
ncbi:hypothetical protein E2C01_010808 [Portunus trituberculatus]|uniref:Uncharacterized protein n=1 Tax=Portunus trituberculatus TaxID=210409 RepID=A0A5B7D9D8_PORTR|nr:hypothetical protein [Portunus trituberculatus]